MKNTIIFIISFLPFLSYSQKKELDNKFSNGDLRLDSIEQTMKNLKQDFEFLKSKSDSLENELLFYKVKEDYYSAALSDQSTRFTLIISGVLALFAVISFGAFKYEVKRIEKEGNTKYLKHKRKFKKHNKKLSKTKNDLVNAKGNLHITIATIYQKENCHNIAFLYHLLGARDHGIRENNRKISNYDVTINNLKFAANSLKNCGVEDIKELNGSAEIINKSFDKISRFKNDTIKKLITEIRFSFNKLHE
tara:strand:+ start:614 stop:1360 length:747 start_codon:yes stop_codon:yes gene_type:complete